MQPLPPPRSTLADNRGFTMLEVLLSMVLIAGSAAIFMSMVGDNQQRTNDRRARVAAQQIALNEIKRLSGTHPWVVPTNTSYVADEFGRILPDPSVTPGIDYTVSISREILCSGGEILVDNNDAPPTTLGCTTERPVARYTVQVIHPSHTRDTGVDTLTQQLTVGPVGRYSTQWTPATAP